MKQAYEWGVDAAKLACKLKLEQQPCCSVAARLIRQVDEFLAGARPPFLRSLNDLAGKLDNPKLTEQCKVQNDY